MSSENVFVTAALEAAQQILRQRLTGYIMSKRVVGTAVPMSLLAEHPNVQFNYYRGGLGSCEVVMH